MCMYDVSAQESFRVLFCLSLIMCVRTQHVDTILVTGQYITGREIEQNAEVSAHASDSLYLYIYLHYSSH